MEDSNVYIRMKLNAAQEVGIIARHLKLPRETTEDQLLATIGHLNADPSVHSILLQLPLDSAGPIDTERCTNAIAFDKVRSTVDLTGIRIHVPVIVSMAMDRVNQVCSNACKKPVGLGIFSFG